MPTLVQRLRTGQANGVGACGCLALVLIHVDCRKLDHTSRSVSEEEKGHEKRLDNDRESGLRMNDHKQRTANE